MTEQKEERKSDREQKEEIEVQERRRKYHEIWEKVCKPVQYYSLYSYLFLQDPLKHNYGDLPLNQSQSKDYLHAGQDEANRLPLITLPEIAGMEIGARVAFRARVHHIRALGAFDTRLTLRRFLT